jgi:hypothetical protein
MSLTRHTFEEVFLRDTRRGWCATCDRRTTRTIKVYQTLNSFNKNPAGEPKTRGEILVELRAEIASKRAAPLYCLRCELPSKVVAEGASVKS